MSEQLPAEAVEALKRQPAKITATESRVEPVAEFGALGKFRTLLGLLYEKYPLDPLLQMYLGEYSEDEELQLLLTDGGHGFQKMLCRQLVLTDQMAVKLLQRALGEQDIVEAARRTKEAARLMSVFQQGVLTLNKVRAGNEQRITVQHVNVSGGNALVAANVRTGGGGREEI